MTDTTTLLTPKPLYVEVAELIRQRIYSRELEPGSWIDEMKMAEAFGISRTPLREALKVLAAEGLVGWAWAERVRGASGAERR